MNRLHPALGHDRYGGQVYGVTSAMNRPFRTARLRFELLEERCQPSASLLSESFDNTAPPSLPPDWQTWASQGSFPFITSRLQSLSGTTALASLGNSGDSGRIWHPTPVPAASGVAISVAPNAPAPIVAVTRGQDLNTSAPSYLGAVLHPGIGGVELLEVQAGQSRSLGQVELPSAVPSTWLRLTLRFTGHQAQVQLQRLDTGEFLHPQRLWQATPGDALTLPVSGNPATGQVGIIRLPGGSGMAFVDDFAVLAPLDSTVQQESFDSTPVGELPENWRRWTNPWPGGFQVTDAPPPGTGRVLASEGGSASQSRAWLAQPVSADLRAAADIRIDTLIPVSLIIRGQNLETDSPSYYAATVTRGMTLELVRVIDGVPTVLASLKSVNYFSKQWIRLELSAMAGRLEVTVVRTDIGQWLNRDGNWVANEAIALETRDTLLPGGGLVGLARNNAFAGRVLFDRFEVRSTAGTAAPSSPATSSDQVTGRVELARKLSHIRIAQLAYSGTPLSDFELQKLRDAVDLVVANPIFHDAIDLNAPATPQLVYSNASNLYLDLLTDWLNTADRLGVSRELAFFHVSQATPWKNASPSAIPVNRFWSVTHQRLGTAATDQTAAAYGARNWLPTLPAAGEITALGYPDRFREIHLNLSRGATSPWRGVIEYPAAIAPDGTVTLWKTLPLRNDGTAGLTRSGVITFDPPRDWVASVGALGSQRLFHLRIRGVQGSASDAPQARTILGRDYDQSGGKLTGGIIPAFDTMADRDGDGYLNDSEYAARRPGFDARFLYESRLIYPNYGPMRFVVNPTDEAVRNWAADYHVRFLQAHPRADGLFLDNSNGRLPTGSAAVIEATANYTRDYADLVRRIQQAIPNRIVVANTVGGWEQANPVAAAVTAAFEEFQLRPMQANWAALQDTANLVASRLAADSPAPYLILDSHPGGGSSSDPRTQLGALAYYYLLADPDRTLMMFFGGANPSAAWSQSWIAAAEVDVGRPAGTMTILASGLDPQNRALEYRVYAREYQNALVLFKPRSYRLGQGTGTTDMATATEHTLTGTYRVLNANGTLGPILHHPTISLRNGEGMILIRGNDPD